MATDKVEGKLHCQLDDYHFRVPARNFIVFQTMFKLPQKPDMATDGLARMITRS